MQSSPLLGHMWIFFVTYFVVLNPGPGKVSLRISGPELTIPRVNRGNLHVQRRTLSRSIGDTKRKAEKLAEFLVVAEKEKRHNRCLESCACDPQKMLLRLYRRGGLPRQKCCGERMPVSLVPFLKNKGALSHLPWKPEWDLHLPGHIVFAFIQPLAIW